VSIEATRTGFEAGVTVPGEKGAKAKRWSIREDSRVWSEDAR
jgi:hypothetical protein